jgi:hypothetical protein
MADSDQVSHTRGIGGLAAGSRVGLFPTCEALDADAIAAYNGRRADWSYLPFFDFKIIFIQTVAPTERSDEESPSLGAKANALV